MTFLMAGNKPISAFPCKTSTSITTYTSQVVVDKK